MNQDEVKVWDPFVRIFHWLLVLSFTVAWLSGEELETLHAWAGYAVTGLVLLRLVWGFIGPRHARFIDFVYRPAEIRAYLGDTLRLRPRRYLGHNPAGGAMILLMLVMLLATALTGMACYGVEEGAGPLAMLSGMSAASGEAFEELHEFFANLMLLLVLVHIAGVLVESLIHHESLVRAMFTGRKHA
jgi:cytochrome b